jgi:hypothetical protein
VDTHKQSTSVGARSAEARGGRNGSVAQTKGLLPSTWVGRGVRLEYVDAYESAQETSGILLDIYPVGPVLSLHGAKTCLSWDRVVFIELMED